MRLLPQRLSAVLVAGTVVIQSVCASLANPQYPLLLPVPNVDVLNDTELGGPPPSRKLQGRFLWITDVHPDPFYKIHSSTDKTEECHRGKGSAGYYGAEKKGCDTPMTLVDATFEWIQENLADQVDFVIWTGDSARHDNDEKNPRSEEQIVSLNRHVADKMLETFGRNDDGYQTPKVIPTLGNNDIMPHNIMEVGPNKWTRRYLSIWEPFIPEVQKHVFGMGGYYFIEVVPNRLAVFSLNTLYFFAKNAAVDGCIDPQEPGAHQFKWLRVQLQLMRERGMKVILMGHVGPARTESKQLWDETCWQMYTLFLHQFRDIIVGSMYGHMDLDHFMFQDYNEVDIASAQSRLTSQQQGELPDGDIGVLGAKDYMLELAEQWSALPKSSSKRRSMADQGATEGHKDDFGASKKKKHRKGGKRKKPSDLGGKWAESFSMSFVSPSIIPAFYPTLRVVSYNITAAEDPPRAPLSAFPPRMRGQETQANANDDVSDLKKKKKKGKKEKKLKITVPKGPSKSAPPGPAYSPQTFSFTSYTQYFANLTILNNDIPKDNVAAGDVRAASGKNTPKPKKFKFEVEYDTLDDTKFKLQDMTVRSYIELARRIGKGAAKTAAYLSSPSDDAASHKGNSEQHADDLQKNKKHKKDKNKKKRKEDRKLSDLWLTFLRRATVSTATDEELMDRFGGVAAASAARAPSSSSSSSSSTSVDTDLDIAADPAGTDGTSYEL